MLFIIRLLWQLFNACRKFLNRWLTIDSCVIEESVLQKVGQSTMPPGHPDGYVQKCVIRDKSLLESGLIRGQSLMSFAEQICFFQV